MPRLGSAIASRRVTLVQRLERSLPRFRGKRRLLMALLGGLDLERVDLAQVLGELDPPNGLFIELDLSDRFERLGALGQYQRDLIQLLWRHLEPGECFCDCGAHVGLVSIPIAARLGAAGQTYAFEPAPATYQRLLRNATLAADAGYNVEALPAALGRTVDEHEMFVSRQHGLSTLSGQAATVGEALGRPITSIARVNVTTLDDFFLATGRRAPQALKIDVEGWEEDVLRGGERFFAEVPPRLVVLERADGILEAMDRSWKTVEDLMAGYGYRATTASELDVVFERAGSA